jgi:hypothetical protein
VAAQPAIAPVADLLMQAAGYQRPNPLGVDPNLVDPGTLSTLAAVAPPTPEAQPGQGAPSAPPQNTSPVFPPIPSDGASPMQGIETPRTSDNMPAPSDSRPQVA